MSDQTNPFDIESVATFGEQVASCDDLKYMRLVFDTVDEYLKSYFLHLPRRGSAIGIRGGHGSGKTHLLSRIADRLTERTRDTPNVLYAKADASSFFAIYRQFVSSLGRDGIHDLIQRALRRLAVEEVQRTKATKTAEVRITSPSDLNKLFDEGILNQDGLTRELRQRLIMLLPSDRVPETLVDALLLTEDSRLGDRAYEWLRGGAIASELGGLGLGAHLLDSNSEESSINDLAGLQAQETIDALHLAAGVPLVIMIDQLEVILKSGGRMEQAFSVLKKLIESLSKHGTFLIIAGNDWSWDIMPLDFRPRLRYREPFLSGSLTPDEVRSFFEAYTGMPDSFTPEALETIRNLSGGNLRELLRIAYHAWEETGGSLQAATPEILRQCATTSGTIADRQKLALEITDRTLKADGLTHQSEFRSRNVFLNRVAFDSVRPIAAILVIAAADRASETELAQHVSAARAYCEDALDGAVLVVVSVGYSSHEVNALLGQVSHIVAFNELTYAEELRGHLVEARRTKFDSTAERTPELVGMMEQIANQLSELEKSRRDEMAQIAERFATGTSLLAQPDKQEIAAETRWEVVRHLDHLERFVREDDPAQQRDLMRAILIANESGLQNSEVDRVGAMFLDQLDAGESPRMRLGPLRYLRSELRRPPPRWLTWLLTPFGGFSLGSITFVGTIAVLASVSGRTLAEAIIYLDLYSTGQALFFSVVVVGFAHYLVWIRRKSRVRRWSRFSASDALDR